MNAKEIAAQDCIEYLEECSMKYDIDLNDIFRALALVIDGMGYETASKQVMQLANIKILFA